MARASPPAPGLAGAEACPTKLSIHEGFYPTLQKGLSRLETLVRLRPARFNLGNVVDMSYGRAGPKGDHTLGCRQIEKTEGG